jgi:uncharacterized protein YkwD
MWEDKLKKILLLFAVLLLFFSCYKTSKDLYPLVMNKNIEKVADTYSSILAENGKIAHNALTEFEFTTLCINYDVRTSTLLEVLASCQEDFLPSQILLLFMDSKLHREALLDENGRYIGAGYTKKNGKIFFTAYVMIPRG